MSETSLYKLITNSYNKKEAQRHCSFIIKDSDHNAVVDNCRMILSDFPQMAHACVPMSCLFASMLRSKHQIPAHVIAGNLSLGTRLLYGNKKLIKSWPKLFSQSNLTWTGHCWIDIAGTISDISFFRSAYDPSTPAWLNQPVVQAFGDGKGALLLTPIVKTHTYNLFYDPQYVLNNEQINTFTNYAMHLIATKPSEIY